MTDALLGSDMLLRLKIFQVMNTVAEEKYFIRIQLSNREIYCVFCSCYFHVEQAKF